jgi:transposase
MFARSRRPTAGLIALAEWLAENGCTHIAMEATGIYWKPVWHILADGEFELILANAAHVKNVPGRKTDVTDAAWLAELPLLTRERATGGRGAKALPLCGLARAGVVLTAGIFLHSFPSDLASDLQSGPSGI